MYLNELDPRYSEHHVWVVDEDSPEFKAGYSDKEWEAFMGPYWGEYDTKGQPADIEDYKRWQEGNDAYWHGFSEWVTNLPHIWRDNPFHNHFVYVEAATADSTIQKQVKAAFQEFYTAWCKGQDLCEFWRAKRVPYLVAKVLTADQKLACEKRLAEIKMVVL